MRFYKTICIICFVILISLSVPVCAQDTKDLNATELNYTNTITQRAYKIVATLVISDSPKFLQVQNILVQQYRNLRDVHDNCNKQLASIKVMSIGTEAMADAVRGIEAERTSQLDKFHVQYINNLAAVISVDQITQVKDGMTYSVVPITYKAYQEMLPNLTDAQKKQIYTWLLEAREHAIDAESSDKKHAWFGKYKGKINNYLSAQGIDMKKAGEEWHQRIKAKKGE